MQVSEHQWASLDSLALPFSVSAGNSIVSYRFTDVGTDATSAHLWFNGVGVAQGGSVDVAASQLSNFAVLAGSLGGTDTLQVQVYDGSNWSAAANVSVNTINHAPIVAAIAPTSGTNQTIAFSSLFNVSDGDGDAITQYRITDASAGGSHLLLNGVQQAENTPITVTAAQLAQLQVANGCDERHERFHHSGFRWQRLVSRGHSQSDDVYDAAATARRNRYWLDPVLRERWSLY